VHVPPGLTGASVSPAALAKLPAAAHHGYVLAYAQSLQTVFLIAVPIAAVAFLLTFLLPEITLRRAIGTPAASEPKEGPLAGAHPAGDAAPPAAPTRSAR
ncbi:MAG TPA: hypothetical protein VFN65_12100, partial [Solirubrobacteraceae bacterium]|nr:hypothetical protein [Solirubrobacteraceae bacterium]